MAVFAFFDAHNGAFNALFSALVAAFTLMLFLVGRDQHNRLSESIGLARQEFTASHRPRLVVRNIVLDRASGNPVSDGHLQIMRPGDHIEGQFYLANAGDTAATIQEALIIFYCSRSGLPMKRPYEGEDGNAWALRNVLAPGESAPVKFDVEVRVGRHTKSATRYGDSDAAFLPGENAFGEDMPFFAMGWVDYLDDAKIRRRVSFCRHYNTAAARFLSLDIPDRDYETEE